MIFLLAIAAALGLVGVTVAMAGPKPALAGQRGADDIQSARQFCRPVRKVISVPKQVSELTSAPAVCNVLPPGSMGWKQFCAPDVTVSFGVGREEERIVCTPRPDFAIKALEDRQKAKTLDRGDVIAKAEAAQIEHDVKAAFDTLSSEAKKRGAAVLSEVTGIPISASDSFDAVKSKLQREGIDALEALGGTAGAAVCGPVCGKVGGIAAAYLGKAAAKYIPFDDFESALASAEEFADDLYSGLTDFAGDVGEAADDVVNFIGGLF